MKDRQCYTDGLSYSMSINSLPRLKNRALLKTYVFIKRNRSCIKCRYTKSKRFQLKFFNSKGYPSLKNIFPSPFLLTPASCQVRYQLHLLHHINEHLFPWHLCIFPKTKIADKLSLIVTTAIIRPI